MLGDHAAYMFALALVALLGVIILSALAQPVPSVLQDVTVGLTIGGAALAKGGRDGEG